MPKAKPNQQYLNKLYEMEILGKGRKHNYFGRIDKIICFITETHGKKVEYNKTILVKVTHTTKTILFAEVIDNDKSE